MDDLGEPEHFAYCSFCERNVGGPYFDVWHARSRRREHIENVHGGSNRKPWTPRVNRSGKRDLLNVVLW